MKRKRRTSITIETTRVMILSTNRGGLNWCPKCAVEVDMLTLEEAEMVTRTSAAELLCKIEEQLLHSIQAPGRQVLICPNSLLR